jgi:hypothetical protein
MWIGTDVNAWCHDLNLSVQRIGMYVTRSFHDQYEETCGLDQMMEDDVIT